MESATSEYSTTSQCLSALLGRPGREKIILHGLRWGENKPAHLSLPYEYILPCDSVPRGTIDTAATRGGNLVILHPLIHVISHPLIHPIYLDRYLQDATNQLVAYMLPYPLPYPFPPPPLCVSLSHLWPKIQGSTRPHRYDTSYV